MSALRLGYSLTDSLFTQRLEPRFLGGGPLVRRDVLLPELRLIKRLHAAAGEAADTDSDTRHGEYHNGEPASLVIQVLSGSATSVQGKQEQGQIKK